ncbi:phosphonate ABC transporter ATP-binding protein [Mycoplasmopsis opalescens]|uniref:phosphonate ABC transporter ATP-binding protein n=1 Tax=Mycoplasmopsis opalescens TaxID=114886 RepID=UPI0004A6C0E2|nr:ATP-binding cassette domain-containing protein [Mycoplasmopsis opalescens]
MEKIIEIKNATIKYKNDVFPTLEDISFDVNKSEMIAIIGPSGVGKSTLFKSLVKAIKLQNGSINIFGQNICAIGKKEWKKIIKKIGFLTQKPNLVSADDVYTNVQRAFIDYKNFIFKIFGILTKQQKVKIFETLEELDILEKTFYRVDDLSGGQQQRVEIAKLLIREVDLILADEPTSNLDNHTAKEVLVLLEKLKNNGKTIIVNIHDLSLVKPYFDRVIALKDKKIVLDCATKEIEQWQLEKIIQKTE